MLNNVRIPCHNKIKGVTINAEIAPANIVTTSVIKIKQMHQVINCIPISIFQGSITRPNPTSPRHIRMKERTNLNSLTTKKQINKDNKIINRYVITVFFRKGGLKILYLQIYSFLSNWLSKSFGVTVKESPKLSIIPIATLDEISNPSLLGFIR